MILDLRAKRLSPAGLVCIAVVALIIGILLVGVASTGCANKNQHPIHPGALNATDSNLYDTLITSQTAIEHAKQQFGSNVAARVVLNKVIVSYNTALDSYLVYKNGNGDPVTVQAQLTNLVQDIAALERQFGVGVLKQ